MPAAGPLSACCSTMRTRGGAPCSSGQVGRPGDELAVGIAPDISSTVTGGRTPRPLELPLGARDSPSSAMSRKQLLQRDAVAALDAEGARDLALAGLDARALQKVEDLLLGRKPARFRGFGSVLGLCHDSLFSTREAKLQCAVSSTAFFRLCLVLRGLLALRGGLLRRALGGSRRDQLDGLVDGDLFRIAVLGERGVDLAVLHIGAVAAGQHLDLAALALGVLAEILEHGRRRARMRPCRCLLGEQADGAVDADGEHLLDRRGWRMCRRAG